ncbi:hypothetical protein [Streptomyces sp. 5-6(2022)]|uniref:hypothetical protein n=1 Tax=Streptomyces sp. 5-6(2022) TaxID=2936510 RepID=UPI0023B8C6A0|nr:hypothetical protein [Streptomyces sp. 5-6(2022)]
MSRPQPEGQGKHPKSSVRSHGRASGHGQVNQAGRDQQIDQHTEHHHHYPVNQIMVLVSGVLVAVVAVLVVKFAGSSTAGDTESRRSPRPSDSAQSHDQSHGTPTPASAAPSTNASKSTESPSPRADTPLWSGGMRLTYINLDSDPPSVLSSNTGASFWIHYDQTGDVREDEIFGVGGGFFTTKPTVARWDGTAKPTRQQCSELITTQGSETLPFAAGQRYCVKSRKGRIAAVTAGAFDEDSGNYAGHITVWNAAR